MSARTRRSVSSSPLVRTGGTGLDFLAYLDRRSAAATRAPPNTHPTPGALPLRRERSARPQPLPPPSARPSYASQACGPADSSRGRSVVVDLDAQPEGLDAPAQRARDGRRTIGCPV